MAKFRFINTKIWEDQYFSNLSANEKLLFIYFISNSLTTVAGTYEITMRRILFDSGIKEEEITKILEKFRKDEKVFYEGGWIFVVNFAKNQQPNPTMRIGVEKEIANLPPHIKPKIEKRFKDCGFFNKEPKTKNKTPKKSSETHYPNGNPRFAASGAELKENGRLKYLGQATLPKNGVFNP